MIEEELTISNRLGIHARPASYLVKIASRFTSKIQLRKDGAEADAKSIMSIMMLAAASGAQVSVVVEGPDERDAFAAVKELFDNRFNEE